MPIDPSKQKVEVTIYTDGACSGNPGPGGWGAILCYKNHQKEISGGEPATTNNRMELMAAIRALECLKSSCTIKLYTDSVYLKNGMNVWLKNWKKKNWIGSNKKKVLNRDLWQRLDELNSEYDIEWLWVAGHSGNPGNDRADELARAAIPDQNDGN